MRQILTLVAAFALTACQDSQHEVAYSLKANAVCKEAIDSGATKQDLLSCSRVLAMLYHSEPDALPGTLLTAEPGYRSKFFVPLRDGSVKMFTGDGMFVRRITASTMSEPDSPVIY